MNKQRFQRTSRNDHDLSVWAQGRYYHQDSNDRNIKAMNGSLGLTAALTDDVRFSISLDVNESNSDLDETGIDSDLFSWGLTTQSSYEPEDHSLRFYSGLSASRLSIDSFRTYLNGIAPVGSEGERRGNNYGGLFQTGWEFSLIGITLTPFAGYQFNVFDLGALEEKTGPVPVTFDAFSDTTHISRLGTKIDNWIGGKTALTGELSWAHLYGNGESLVRGSIPILNSDFAFVIPGENRDWGELNLGVSSRLDERLTVSASLDANSDFQENTGFGGTVSIEFRI